MAIVVNLDVIMAKENEFIGTRIKVDITLANLSILKTGKAGKAVRFPPLKRYVKL